MRNKEPLKIKCSSFHEWNSSWYIELFRLNNEHRISPINYSPFNEPNVKGLNRLLQITRSVNTRIQIINNFIEHFQLCVCVCVYDAVTNKILKPKVI